MAKPNAFQKELIMKLSRVVLPIVLSSWLNVACASTIATPATDTASPKPATTAYEPVRGQAGKDVIWIPTPAGLIDKMLSAAKVTPQDRLFDLGAGDGIIAITAARQYGTTSVGIEYNPDMAQFARRKVAEAGMADKVKIITGDIFQEDFSSATVVTLYLMPHLNLKLRPLLLKMKPGTRVVSHAFTMGDWEPDETMS
jgi:2-polyprenyl-3-methyl-5-hydroxy-6-metoxy-1,4-benzoquinol methylase